MFKQGKARGKGEEKSEKTVLELGQASVFCCGPILYLDSNSFKGDEEAKGGEVVKNSDSWRSDSIEGKRKK